MKDKEQEFPDFKRVVYGHPRVLMKSIYFDEIGGKFDYQVYLQIFNPIWTQARNQAYIQVRDEIKSKEHLQQSKEQSLVPQNWFQKLLSSIIG